MQTMFGSQSLHALDFGKQPYVMRIPKVGHRHLAPERFAISLVLRCHSRLRSQTGDHQKRC